MDFFGKSYFDALAKAIPVTAHVSFATPGTETSNEFAENCRINGNQFFKQREFFKSLLNYNLTLCYAEDREQRALAYANRSAVYLEVKQYEKCLKNIQLALEHDYPKEKKKTLESRLAKCNKLMEKYKPDPSDDPWNFFKLSYKPHPKIPFLAECIEVHKEEAGWQAGVFKMTTNRELKAGDIIAITDPLFRFADPTARIHRCCYCFKDCLLDLIPCAGCTQAMFCSEECQSQADFHFMECKSWKVKPFRISPKLDFLFGKMHSRVLAMFDGSKDEMSKFLKESANSKSNVSYLDFDWNNIDEKTREKNLLSITLSMPRYEKFKNFLMLSFEELQDFFAEDSSEDEEAYRFHYKFSERASKKDLLAKDLKPVVEVYPFQTNVYEQIMFHGEYRSNKVLQPHVVLNYHGEMFDPLANVMQYAGWNICRLPVSNKLVYMATTKIKAGSHLNAYKDLGYPTDKVEPKECTYDPSRGYSFIIPVSYIVRAKMDIIMEPQLDCMYLEHYGRDGCLRSCCRSNPEGSKPSGLRYVQSTSKAKAAEAFHKNNEIIAPIPFVVHHEHFAIDTNVLNLEILKKPAAFYP